MSPKRSHTFAAAAVSLSLLTTTLLVSVGAQQPPPPVVVDPDDIGGTVSGPGGPEAGVWVIAETRDLAVRFIRIVVTDDRGRYLVPDLPGAPPIQLQTGDVVFLPHGAAHTMADRCLLYTSDAADE